VNDRCTDSTLDISVTVQGDQTLEQL